MECLVNCDGFITLLAHFKAQHACRAKSFIGENACKSIFPTVFLMILALLFC